MYQNINEMEERLVSDLDGNFLLNRVQGGLNGDLPGAVRYLLTMGSMTKRNFQFSDVDETLINKEQ